VAVILNGHARGVSPSVLRRIGRLVPKRDLYVSRTLDQASAIAERVVDRGYDAVLLGGGDGTFVQCATDLRESAARHGTPVPRLGVLRLGTGNALAFALGASQPTLAGMKRDLSRAAEGAPAQLEMLEVDGKLTPFAGVGLDAQILDDFHATTRLLGRFGIGRSLGSGARYALSVAFRSTPRFVASPAQEVVAVNLGAPAFRLGRGGERIGPPIFRGEVLWRGRCSLAAGSTIPFYGLGMKMFPFAGTQPGRFHLRCTDCSAAEIIGHLPAVWRGEYASPRLADFLVERAELRLERPAPIQIGGDVQPIQRDRITLALASAPVTVVQ
jgi:diacylglycerol kinase family enzyme